MPAECLLQACNDAGSALQAPVRRSMYITLRAERVNFRRANEDTVLWLAFHATDFVIDLDVAFLVYLEDIPPEFLFHLHVPTPLDFQQIECVLHC